MGRPACEERVEHRVARGIIRCPAHKGKIERPRFKLVLVFTSRDRIDFNGHPHRFERRLQVGGDLLMGTVLAAEDTERDAVPACGRELTQHLGRCIHIEVGSEPRLGLPLAECGRQDVIGGLAQAVEDRAAQALAVDGA